MIAYNKSWLDNLLLLQQSRRALRKGLINKAEWEQIREKHSIGFYTPNFFIRVGLFLLTLIICLATTILLMLIFIDDIDGQLPLVTVILAALSYIAAELIVARKKHFRSGVTEALIWVFAASLVISVTDYLNLGELGIYITIYLVSTWLSFRFADLLSAVVSFLSFLGILFYASRDTSELTASLAPFLLMTSSCVTYILVRQFDEKNILRHYKHCLELVEIVALMALYAAGNYYVIDRLNTELLATSVRAGANIPYSIVFWLATIIIPPAYVVVGILKKDFILYRVGLLLLIAMVMTITHYYNVLSIELLMTFGGTLLIGIAWWLARYLRNGKFGYTSVKQQERSVIGEQIESLAIAETFSTPASNQDQINFGGGSFGGAGAGDNY